MAEQDNSQEKTLDPTQKRLDKAKEDGDILSSKEMFVFGSSLMGLILLFCLEYEMWYTHFRIVPHAYQYLIEQVLSLYWYSGLGASPAASKHWRGHQHKRSTQRD